LRKCHDEALQSNAALNSFMHVFHIDKFEVDIYHFFFVLNKICRFFLFKKMFFLLFIALLRYLSILVNIDLLQT